MDRKSRTANADVVFQWLSCVAVVIAMSCAPLSASTANLIANNTPSYVATAKNLGAEDPAKVIEVSIWLQLHNQSQFDALTQSLYDRSSPNYHHWLRPNDIAAGFAPTAQEAKTVQQFFCGAQSYGGEDGSQQLLRQGARHGRRCGESLPGTAQQLSGGWQDDPRQCW